VSETKIAQENGLVRRAESIDELARKVGGEIREIVQGEQWAYAIIATKSNVQIWKYSPKTRHQLYTRGFIALSFEDAIKVLETALKVAKEEIRKRLLEKAKELGIQL